MKRVKIRSKQTEQQEERIVNDPFTKLPDDINIVILMKLPPRSIARLRFASKRLSSLILGKEFTELYMTRSSTQLRHLVAVYGHGLHYRPVQRFHSISQEYPSSTNHDMVDYKLHPCGPYPTYEFTPPVRGLICGQYGNKMMVGNPSTGQFKPLPRVRTTKTNILSVFGYDPVNDVYKVLCMTLIAKRSKIYRGVAPWDAMSEEHQVITIGAKQKWRMIECNKYPHRHYSGYDGICRDGVMYYLACYKEKRTLMRFDLSSEEFNVTNLPEDGTLQQFGELVNHSGKITVATQRWFKPVDIWVLEDVNKEVWSKTVVVVPSLGFHRIELRGILGTGEMIFVPDPSCSPLFFLCYNPEGEKFREVVIDIGNNISDRQLFFDHVESYMVLSKVC